MEALFLCLLFWDCIYVAIAHGVKGVAFCRDNRDHRLVKGGAISDGNKVNMNMNMNNTHEYLDIINVVNELNYQEATQDMCLCNQYLYSNRRSISG